jgi:hypothetical protein
MRALRGNERKEGSETNVKRDPDDRWQAIRNGRGPWPTRREACALVGLSLAVSFCSQWQQLAATASAIQEPWGERSGPDLSALAATVSPPTPLAVPLRTLIKTDPTDFFRGAIERYERSGHDYTCTFSKQERIGGHLMPEQVMQVRFREKPFSVDMLWVKNAGKARRAIYVEGRWRGKHGEKLALVEPTGVIARFLVAHVLRPIDGSDARQAARHPIDHFGFANTLRLILEDCDLGAQREDFTVRYVGESTIGGRPTYLVELRWADIDETHEDPQQLLVVDVDQEYLLPTCCALYADEAGTELLERYVMTDIEFDVGLTDRDFLISGD